MSRIDDNQIGLIDWREFEEATKTILESTGSVVTNFKVNGKKKFKSIIGEEYEIDASVEFEMFKEAKFLVLIECKSKKQGNKVERDEVLAFNSKIRALNAQKGIFFTTSGYQKGAIEYAKHNSIALVQVVRGKTLYLTKGMEIENTEPPDWVKLPKYAGWLVGLSESGQISYSLVRPEIQENLFT